MKDNILKSRQVKAARTLLNWSQEQLAQISNLSIATIRKLEAGSMPRNATMQFVRAALEENGLEFIEPGGIRHRAEDVVIYQSEQGVSDFFDDMYQTLKKKGGEVVTICPSEEFLFPPSAEESLLHLERMKNIQNKISVKILLTEDARNLKGEAYSEYRIMRHTEIVPFIVYADTYALVVSHGGITQKIIAIQSSGVAQAFRKQFQVMWEQAAAINIEMKKGKK